MCPTLHLTAFDETHKLYEKRRVKRLPEIIKNIKKDERGEASLPPVLYIGTSWVPSLYSSSSTSLWALIPKKPQYFDCDISIHEHEHETRRRREEEGERIRIVVVCSPLLSIETTLNTAHDFYKARRPYFLDRSFLSALLLRRSQKSFELFS